MIRKFIFIFLTFFSFTLSATNDRLISFEEYLKKDNHKNWLPSYFLFSDIFLYQKTLLTLGYSPGPIDGVLGPKTIKAIKEFQRDNSLVPDGIVGDRTREAFLLKGVPNLYLSNENLSDLLKSNYRPRTLFPYIIKSTTNSQECITDYKGRLVPFRAENGSYYGQISKATGRPKVVHVTGYYRKDGTYVRSYYRSRPRR